MKEDQIELFVIALALVGIQTTQENAELIIETHKTSIGLADDFSIKDAKDIRDRIYKKYYGEKGTTEKIRKE